MTGFEQSVLDQLERLTTAVDRLELLIGGNGDPGIHDRLRDVEQFVVKHKAHHKAPRSWMMHRATAVFERILILVVGAMLFQLLLYLHL